MVRMTFVGYLVFSLSVVTCIVSSLIGWDTVLDWNDGMIYFIMLLIVVVLMVIGLSTVTKVFDNPHDYVSYFKKFDKQDEKWLRKWKRSTILLFIGGLLSAVLSFFFRATMY